MLRRRIVLVVACLSASCGDDGDASLDLGSTGADIDPPEAGLPDGTAPDAAASDARVDAELARTVCDEPGVEPGQPGAGGRPSISRSDASSIEAEAHIAADGMGNVAAAWIAIARSAPGIFPGGDWWVGYAVSHDDGESWSAPRLVPGRSEGECAADPVVVATGPNAFSLVWIQFTCDADPLWGHTLWTAGIDPATDTTTDRVVVAEDPTIDKDWATADADGNVLVTWWGEGLLPNQWHLMLSRGPAAGPFETVEVAVSPPRTSISFPQPCVSGGDGPVYVVYEGLDAEHAWAGLYRSDDGDAWHEPGAEEIGSIVARSVSCAARGDDVWVSFLRGARPALELGDSVLERGAEVVVRHSGDRGATWDPPIAVTGDPAVDHTLPQIDLDADGAVVLAWLEGEVDGPGTLELARAASSAPFERVASSPLGLFHVRRDGPCFPGDYFGLDVAGGAAWIARPDLTSTPLRTHVVFERVSLR